MLVFTARIVAERGIAMASCPFVRPHVCISVTLRYRGHIGWNSAKIISHLFTLFAPQHDGSTPKVTSPNFSRNRSGVGKIVDFRHLSRRISEHVQDRVQIAIDH